MPGTVTNAELLRRVADSHAVAGLTLRQLTAGAPPPTVTDLYAAIKQLRNATRAAYNASQELKNRVKASVPVEPK